LQTTCGNAYDVRTYYSHVLAVAELKYKYSLHNYAFTLIPRVMGQEQKLSLGLYNITKSATA